MPFFPIRDAKKFKHQTFPEQIGTSLFEDPSRSIKLISKNTKITSMGSCFARNISTYLLKKGYNYLITEYPYSQASAHWEQVFNTACIRQVFEYAFNENWNPTVRWWPRDPYLQDPFRQNILYKKETVEEDFERHRKGAYEALSQAEVVVITLGLIEVWRDKRDKMTFFRVPSPRVYSTDIHEFYVQKVDDCLADLNTLQSILNSYNPKASIIVTVSPIPLSSTFRTDTDIVSANTLSKSTLRVAAEYFSTKHTNVHYFPSYEIVTKAIPDPNQEDNIHPKKSTINKVMQVFETMFCKD